MLLPSDARASDAIRVVPLRSPTLPPATHTNMVLVGRQRVWVVDPATLVDGERARALDAVEGLSGEGRRPVGILLTHHHHDHVCAANWLRGETGLEIFATARTRDLLGDGLPVDVVLGEGDVLDGSDDGGDRWLVLETPGHASGHLVLWQKETGWMVAGDMVASEGTIIIEPPDGHMTTYIDQLERLASLAPSRLVPSHGDIVSDPVALFAHYVGHRLEREERVVGALAEGPADLATLTVRSYPELHPSILPLAERSCLAHLIRLEEHQRAHRDAEHRWSTLD